MRFPLSGRARDFHPLDYAHVGRTTTKTATPLVPGIAVFVVKTDERPVKMGKSRKVMDGHHHSEKQEANNSWICVKTYTQIPTDFLQTRNTHIPIIPLCCIG